MDQTYQFTAAQGLRQINRGWELPLTVVNAGLISLQITDDPNGGSQGLALPPGASIVWDAGRPLNAYVLTGTAGTGVLTVLENSGTVSNPAAIAAALVASGLTADAIGGAIALQGAPPLNRFDQIANATSPLIAVAGSLTLGTWNVSKYNAVRWLDSYNLNGGLFAFPPPARPLDFIWLLDNNGVPGSAIDSERYYTYSGTAGQQSASSIVTPIKGAWLRVTALPEVGGASASGGTIIYFLGGQYLQVGDPMTVSNFQQFGNNSGWAVSNTSDTDNYWWISGAKVNAVTISDWPPVQSGPVFWQVSTTAVTVGQIQVQLLDIVDGTVVDQFTFPVAAGSSQARQIIMPNRLVQLRVIGGAAATVAVSMSSLPR